MKHILALLSLTVCGAMLAAPASAQSTKPGVVTVVRIKGEARYSLGDNQWHPLVVGKVLRAGAVIQTAANSMVDIVLGGTMVAMPQARPTPSRISPAPDYAVRGLISYKPMVEQNVVRLWGDTVLAVDKLTVAESGLDLVSDTELDLRAGRIFGSVKKLSAASQYLIKIPNGVAGVRGTTFSLSANGMLSVFTGSVVLSYVGSDGKTVTVVVNAGSQYNLETASTTELSQEELDVLRTTAIATQTLFHEAISYASDKTTVFVSPTTGTSSPPPAD